MRNAGRGHQGRILPQPPGIGRNPRREQFGERPDAAQQREGGLRGDFGIEKPVAPEGELPGRKARRIGDVQLRDVSVRVAEAEGVRASMDAEPLISED